ncbi:MAG TPA: PPK2 family polyphosphate kinase [Thermomicrobiales bacterium]|nr:PPK2 family polyphosphate kinase [Thermomicrobiales bacterium]
MPYALTVEPGTTVELSDFPTGETGGLDKDAAHDLIKPLKRQIRDLQGTLYASAQNAVLIVLQGMDTSGKDGTVSSVLESVNPLGCRVWPFKTPTPLESAHDFLWRVHEKVPEKGMMTVFNRSHYEDVLIARVKELVPKTVWSKHYNQINEFEELLVESGTIILKFFLHISKDEQKERLMKRERDPIKAWKLSAGDWVERQYWNQYQQAYEVALSKCSTKFAPWYVIPADHKWYRDLAVAQQIVDTMEPYEKKWMKSLEEMGKVQLAEIARIREKESMSGLTPEERKAAETS